MPVMRIYTKSFNRKGLNRKSSCVIIPAFNEERTLRGILRNIPFKTLHSIVVDDGSGDKTAIIARREGATVLSHKKNLGVGLAVKTGFRSAVQQGFRTTILMDADGQHDPKDIPFLLAETHNGADYVIASRYVNDTPRATSKLRTMGTRIISLWIWTWFGKRIYDPTSGYRAIGNRAFGLFSSRYPTFFPEPEALLEALEHGLVIKEIPSVMSRRMYGKSSISWFKATALMIYILAVIPCRAIVHNVSISLASCRQQRELRGRLSR
jgi:glycosyltransferase involved in cell wall biosynthesis